MRITPGCNKSRTGSVLMVTVFIGIVIGFVLISTLSLVNSQNQSVVRSQAWNNCIPVLEAGIEEAMAHLNNKKEASLAVNGWVQNGDTYSRFRPLDESFYVVKIILSNIVQPVIVCTGYVRAPLLFANPGLAAAGVDIGGVQYIPRAVEVIARKEAVFVKGMVVLQGINMNGNGIGTDSFDSSDPNHSTPQGLYDPITAKDNGDVATTAGGNNIINVGNADIKGRLRTGAGGSVTLGPGSTVGSLAWHAAGNSGIEPGWSTDDMNVYFPPVEAPFNGGAFSPTSGSVTGYTYKYLLTGGNYQISSLTVDSKEKIGISNATVLYVTGDVDVAGDIDILPGGSLELYVGGSKTTLGGKGINATGHATNFVYYGLPSNKNLTLPSNGDFTGAIYAPNTDLVLSGGGAATMNFCGACITQSASVNGHYQFHYDEALRKFGPSKDYVIISWVEL
jgi:hypothetical protein